MSSSKITSELQHYTIIEDNRKKLKTEIRKSLEEKYKNVIERLTTEMNDKEKRYVDTSTQAVVSNCLTLFSIKEFGFE